MLTLVHVIHGKKHVEEKLGKVADFCPICHEIRCFDFKRISLTKHFYFMAYGKRKHVSDRIECATCGLWLAGDAARYVKMEKLHIFQNNADWLMQNTFPKLPEFYAERLAFEKELKRNPKVISQRSRAEHMLEMFLLVNPQLEASFKGRGITRFDKRSVMVAGVLLALLGIMLAAVNLLPDETRAQTCAEIGAIITLFFMAVFGLTQFFTVPRRKLRNQMLPWLARGLRPFDPLEEELTALLAKCKSAGMFIAGKVTERHLIDELSKPIFTTTPHPKELIMGGLVKDWRKARVKNIDDCLDRAPEFSRAICVQLREWIFEWEPDLDESIKWDMPTYKGAKMVCSLGAFKKHATIFFFRGTELPDPAGLFNQGTGSHMRAIRITTLKGFDRTALRALLRAAVILDADPMAPPPLPAKRKPMPMPAFFKRALKENPKSAAGFKTLAPTYQREYIAWLGSAKQEETRARRLAEALPALAKGLKYSDRRKPGGGV